MKIKAGNQYVKKHYDRDGFNGIYTITRVHSFVRDFHVESFIFSELQDGRIGRYNETFFREHFRPRVDVNQIWKDLNA